MADGKHEAAEKIDAHGKKIDDLHGALNAIAGTDKAKLNQAVAKYKAAHQAFHDDALECVH